MRLLHHSRQPLGEVKSVPQLDSSYDSSYWKPNGLWVSVEGPDDWRSWCESEQWGLDKLVHATEVILASDANVLHLRTADGVRMLGREYGTQPDNGEPFYTRAGLGLLDWKRIATKYQGIIIAPYQWECRFSEQWYYTWDCASGCIWDAAAILTTTPIHGGLNGI